VHSHIALVNHRVNEAVPSVNKGVEHSRSSHGVRRTRNARRGRRHARSSHTYSGLQIFRRATGEPRIPVQAPRPTLHGSSVDTLSRMEAALAPCHVVPDQMAAPAHWDSHSSGSRAFKRHTPLKRRKRLPPVTRVPRVTQEADQIGSRRRAFTVVSISSTRSSRESLSRR
jgi:hypothetical protein